MSNYFNPKKQRQSPFGMQLTNSFSGRKRQADSDSAELEGYFMNSSKTFKHKQQVDDAEFVQLKLKYAICMGKIIEQGIDYNGYDKEYKSNPRFAAVIQMMAKIRSDLLKHRPKCGQFLDQPWYFSMEVITHSQMNIEGKSFYTKLRLKAGTEGTICQKLGAFLNRQLGMEAVMNDPDFVATVMDWALERAKTEVGGTFEMKLQKNLKKIQQVTIHEDKHLENMIPPKDIIVQDELAMTQAADMKTTPYPTPPSSGCTSKGHAYQAQNDNDGIATPPSGYTSQ